MPDSTLSPGNPALLRDSDGQWRDHGAGALRRTSPAEPSAAAPKTARARSSPYGTVARAQRIEPRWRDLQWVDFVTDPIAEEVQAPAAVPETPETAEPAPPVTPEFGSILRHFHDPGASSASGKVIAGLAPRFTRVGVPRLLPVAARPSRNRKPPPEVARLAAMRKSGAAAAPRLDIPPAAPTQASNIAPRFAAPPLQDPPPLAMDARPFPASILTPVSIAPALPETAPRRRWRAMVGAPITRSDLGLHRAYEAIATAMGRLARPGMFVRRRSAVPAISIEGEAISSPAMVARRKITLGNLVRSVAGHKRQLRHVALVALALILMALTAYGAGALLVRLAGTHTAATRHPPPANPTAQTAQNAAPTPTPTPANALPADPAARAAFYMIRAKAGDAAAQYDLGVLYARGDGLVQDYASAASWFRAAAAQGNIVAQYNLGVLYERGLGVSRNETEALNWYRSAADQNHPAAQFNLALAFANGNGAKQDFATAARWYQRAARRGLTPAMVNLAIFYEQGYGVDQSYIDAYAWYSAAGERNDTGASQRAGELFEQFDDKDKARAEGLAATIGAALDETPPAA
jgi:hypothetical protein